MDWGFAWSGMESLHRVQRFDMIDTIGSLLHDDMRRYLFCKFFSVH